MDATGGAALTPPMTDRPIRVLHVMEATIGGTKRHLLDLAAAADRRDFQIEVACPRVRSEPRGDTSFFDDISTLDVAVHVTPMVRAIRPIKGPAFNVGTAAADPPWTLRHRAHAQHQGRGVLAVWPQ